MIIKAADKYQACAASCCTKFSEVNCGITYRMNS